MNMFTGLGIDPDAIARHVEGDYVQDALKLTATLQQNAEGIAGLIDDVIAVEVSQWKEYRVEDMVDEPPDIRVRTNTMRMASRAFGLCGDTTQQIVINLVIALSQLAARLDTAENKLNTRGLN